MSDFSGTPDQSMDEILKKIERGLAEEAKAESQAPDEVQPSAEVLQLAEASGDNRKSRSANRTKGSPGAETAPQEPPESDAASAAPEGRSLSEAVAGSAAAALAQLAAIQRERRRAVELPMADADRTLEDVVRELVRPMLQGWLDERLSGVIERIVQAELARAVAEGGAS